MHVTAHLLFFVKDDFWVLLFLAMNFFAFKVKNIVDYLWVWLWNFFSVWRLKFFRNFGSDVKLRCLTEC